MALRELSPDSVKLARQCASSNDDIPPGNSVLRFCRDRIGRKVGDGQCATLATMALVNAGADGRGEDHPNPGDYVWGNFVARFSTNHRDVIAKLGLVAGGDVIQFRNARFQGNSPSGVSYWMQASHHTAIVESVDVPSGAIRILHQNWNGKKMVRRDVLVVSDLREGWLRVYRPRVGRQLP